MTTRRGRLPRRRSRTAHAEIGGSGIGWPWHGSNHSPDKHLHPLARPRHADARGHRQPGWAPVYLSNPHRGHSRLRRGACDRASYPWKHFIAGHLGRLEPATTSPCTQQYMADIAASVRTAIDHGRSHAVLREVRRERLGRREGPSGCKPRPPPRAVIEKYTGVLAAADVFTASTTSGSWNRSASTRLRLPVHPEAKGLTLVSTTSTTAVRVRSRTLSSPAERGAARDRLPPTQVE